MINYEFNPTDSIFEILNKSGVISKKQDAVLLSLIPYGSMSVEACSIFLLEQGQRARVLQRLAEQGYISKRFLKIKCKGQKQSVSCISINEKGVAYLSEKYSWLYPWLPVLLKKVLEHENRIIYRANMSNEGMYRFLTDQLNDVFFSYNGIESFQERLRLYPVQAAKILLAGCKKKAELHFFPSIAAKAILEYYEGERAEKNAQDGFSLKERARNRYFNKWEMESIRYGIYAASNTIAMQVSGEINPRYPLGYRGILVGTQKDSYFLVFSSQRKGISLNSAAWLFNRARVCKQMVHLGICSSLRAAELSASPNVLILTPPYLSSFKNVILDSHHFRGENDKALGIGTNKVCVFPREGDDAGALISQMLNNAHYEKSVVNALIKMFPAFCRNDDEERLCPVSYHDMPCCIGGLVLDPKRLYLLHEDTKEGKSPKYLLCFDWQIDYLLKVMKAQEGRYGLIALIRDCSGQVSLEVITQPT